MHLLNKFLRPLFIVSLFFIVFNVFAEPYVYRYDLPLAQDYAMDGNTALVSFVDQTVKAYVNDGYQWIEQGTLVPGRVIEDFDLYGYDLAIQGNTALVTSRGYCARYDEPEGPGAIFVFTRNGTTWTKQQEIAIPCNAGQSIDLDGNSIIVSDEGDYDDYTSRVLFFQYNGTTWASSGDFDVDTYSCSCQNNGRVAIDGDLALAVGESGNEEELIVRVYKRTGGVWAEQTTLPYPYTNAGYDIDIDGNIAVIGSKVYTTNGTTWSLQGDLAPLIIHPNLGIGVFIQGDTILNSTSDSGAYLFTRSNGVWSAGQAFIADGLYVSDKSVYLSNGIAIVGQYTFTNILQKNELPIRVNYSLSGNTALAGIDVYTRSVDMWTKQATLNANRSFEYWERYGTASVIQGDTALVTSYGNCPRYDEDGGPGSLFVFKRIGTTWTQQQELSFNCQFGESLDIDGNTIIVSDEGEYDSYINSVIFLQYNGTSWTQVARFDTNPSGNPGLDSNVAISGDLALASGEDFSRSGLTRVYKRVNGVWTEQTTLPVFGDLDISGNTALIGSKVYITDGTNWTLQTTLSPNEATERFGTSVALEGNTAVISGSDKSFVFTRSGNVWTQTQKLSIAGKDIGVGDIYSSQARVAISGSIALVREYTFDIASPPVDTTPQLLVNGGFEIDSDGNSVPDGWNRKHSTKDGRRCNKPAYEGNCAYMFRGMKNANSRLIQNVDLNTYNLKAGDRIRLNGFYDKQSRGSIFVLLSVSYNGLPEDKAMVKMTARTDGYKALDTTAVTLKAPPTRVRVEFINRTTWGRTYIDGLMLSKNLAQLEVTTQELMPLPESDNLLDLPQP